MAAWWRIEPVLVKRRTPDTICWLNNERCEMNPTRNVAGIVYDGVTADGE